MAAVSPRLSAVGSSLVAKVADLGEVEKIGDGDLAECRALLVAHFVAQGKTENEARAATERVIEAFAW